jgi:hypothetical protein
MLSIGIFLLPESESVGRGIDDTNLSLNERGSIPILTEQSQSFCATNVAEIIPTPGP